MKTLKFWTVVLTAVSLFLPLSAQDKVSKIATVDMGRLITGFYKGEQLRESFKGYEKEISAQNEERVETIKAIIEEARNLQKQGDDPSMSAEKRNELFKQAGAKNRDGP